MSFWGSAFNVAKGAGAGFLSGGPAGAMIGGGLALGNEAMGGGGGGGFMPGSGGFQLQNDAINNQMNLSNSLMNMGQEQFAQESPYRSNMLNMLQQRAAAQMPTYQPTAPTMYNPYQNTYRVAPTHGPASAPRGHQGFAGGPAYAQAQAPQQTNSAYNPGAGGMQEIPGAGGGGQMPVGQALDGYYGEVSGAQTGISGQPVENINEYRGEDAGWNAEDPYATWENTYNPATGSEGSGDGLHLGVSYENPDGEQQYGQGGTDQVSVRNPWDWIGQQRALANEDVEVPVNPEKSTQAGRDEAMDVWVQPAPGYENSPYVRQRPVREV